MLITSPAAPCNRMQPAGKARAALDAGRRVADALRRRELIEAAVPTPSGQVSTSLRQCALEPA